MHLSFGIDGNAAPRLGPGWSVPAAGFTWAEGGHSRRRPPPLSGRGALVLGLVVSPLLHAPGLVAQLVAQRVALTVDDVALPPEPVCGPCAIDFRVPAAALTGRATLDVVLDCPDAACPVAPGSFPDPRRGMP